MRRRGKRLCWSPPTALRCVDCSIGRQIRQLPKPTCGSGLDTLVRPHRCPRDSTCWSGCSTYRQCCPTPKAPRSSARWPRASAGDRPPHGAHRVRRPQGPGDRGTGPGGHARRGATVAIRASAAAREVPARTRPPGRGMRRAGGAAPAPASGLRPGLRRTRRVLGAAWPAPAGAAGSGSAVGCRAIRPCTACWPTPRGGSAIGSGPGGGRARHRTRSGLPLGLVLALRVAHRLDRHAEALAIAERLVADRPRQALAHEVHAEVLEAVGQHDERVEALRRALALQPRLGSSPTRRLCDARSTSNASTMPAA